MPDKDRRKDVGGKVVGAVLTLIVIGVLFYGIVKADKIEAKENMLALNDRKQDVEILSLTQMMCSQQTLSAGIQKSLADIKTSVAVIEERTKKVGA